MWLCIFMINGSICRICECSECHMSYGRLSQTIPWANFISARKSTDTHVKSLKRVRKRIETREWHYRASSIRECELVYLWGARQAHLGDRLLIHKYHYVIWITFSYPESSKSYRSNTITNYTTYTITITITYYIFNYIIRITRFRQRREYFYQRFG